MGEEKEKPKAGGKKAITADDKLKVKKWNDVHRKTLQKSLNYVCTNTSSINRIHILLMEKGIITHSEIQEINGFNSDEKKMLELIALLLKKGHKCLQIFKDILIQTGNEGVEEVIRSDEYAVNKMVEQKGDSDDDDDSESGKKKKKKKGKKSGKLFSVYEAEEGKGFSVFTATDDEDSESDIEDILDSIDEDNPDKLAVLDYLQYAEQKSKMMMYYPQTLFRISRFKDLPTEAVLPKERYQDAILRFKGNRVLFLKMIKFYGPATIPLTSYEVILKVSIPSKKPGAESVVLGEISEVIECRIGQLMNLIFKDPVPIRPHVWHDIQFTIKGQERMAAQSEETRDKFLYMDYQIDTYDAVRLEYDISQNYVLGQIPELCFNKAKDRIPSEFFVELPDEAETDPPSTAVKNNQKPSEQKLKPTKSCCSIS